MADIISSIINHFKNKASTTLFAIYFSFWAVFHAQGIICLLFTDQDYIYNKFGMLKNEYLFTYHFGINDPSWWIKHLCTLTLTALYVLFFARWILNPIYKYEIKYKTERKIVKAKNDIEFQKAKNKLDQSIAKNAKYKADMEEAQKRQIEANPELQWEKEYQQISNKQNLDVIINDLKDLYYNHQGDTVDIRGQLVINIQSLTMCEAYGLIERNAKNSSFIKITEKGWFFIRKHG